VLVQITQETKHVTCDNPSCPTLEHKTRITLAIISIIIIILQKSVSSAAGYTGGLCGWPVGVEFFARLLARFWYWQRQIQTTSENVYVRFVRIQRIRGFFYVYVQYKFTLTLILDLENRQFARCILIYPGEQ